MDSDLSQFSRRARLRLITARMLALSSHDVPGWRRLRCQLLCWLLRAPGLKVGTGVRLDRSHPQLGGWLSLGRDVELGAGTVIDLSGGVIIESGVTISEGARLFSHDHEMRERSIHWRVQPIRPEPLTIREGSWIGAGAIVLGSCREVGEGGIVAAGAVVSHPVAKWSIVAGVPAREIGMRT